ncbi:MAG: hypothetical protein QOE33_168 [Acidobacteriota bacterium]|nr:hypothetical protein [Acidobacteriota bacterium]
MLKTRARRRVRQISLSVVALIIIFAAACAGQHVRPRRATQGDDATPTSDQTSASIINVRAGGDLQAALERARAGDTIMLAAGATYHGAFRLPNKAGANFITVRSSAADAQLPATGERIDPAKYANALPKLVGGVAGSPVVAAAPGAHHFRFVAVEFGATVGGQGNIIELGTGQEESLDALPHDIEFDRCYIHGDPKDGQRRGIALNARAVKIANSYFADIKRRGEESQALCGWGGTGPFEITNNYIEAAAEGVMFGGATTRLKVVPSDIIVSGNHFNKPLNWRDEGWSVKNHLELKNARRVHVESNLFTNTWASAQDGTAVLFTVRDEGGQVPDATVEDVEFINNVVRGAANCFQAYGAEGRGGHRLTIRNNLFTDVDARFGAGGKFLVVTQWDTLTVEQNTIITSGSITTAFGQPTTGFVFRRNIVKHNDYGFHGDGRAPDADAVHFFFPGAAISDNAIVGGVAFAGAGRNVYPSTLDEVGFVNWRAGDFHLRANSSLRRTTASGPSIGAQVDELPQT